MARGFWQVVDAFIPFVDACWHRAARES